MKVFGTLLRRELREWRTVLIVLTALYMFGLIGAAVGLRYFSNDILSGAVM